MPRLSTPRILPMPSVMFLPGMKAPGGTNTPFMPARALGAPQTTCTGSPDPVSTMHTQAVGVRMLFGRDHAGDGERREHLAPLDDALDFKSDHGEPVHNGCQRRLGVEVLLQPSEGQFHHCADPG